MCGFLVEYTTQSELIDTHSFCTILKASAQRGPDSKGYEVVDEYVQLGFNRLAIQDTSAAGNQPLSSASKRYTIVFNGEIYNHLQLRKQLNQSTFNGHSDTETISACLDEWGIKETIQSLNGMFAIVIYDREQRSITLARDFAGIKPLFYAWDGAVLFASSQYDQLIQHPRFSSKSINLEVLKLYLEQHFMPAPFGVYQDTFQVEPGQYITLYENGKLEKSTYWEIENTLPEFIANEQDIFNLVSETLHQVVSNQLIADVPLGTFLSGGVDSTLIASSIPTSNSKLAAFTMGSDSIKHDESERAKAFATAMQLEHHLWNLNSKEVVTYWEEAMQALHEPMADFSILPTYLVSKLASNHVTVALSGDGGDELFFGYERFWSIGKNIKYQHYPYWIKKGIYGWDKVVSNKKKFNEILVASSQSKAHQGLHARFRKDKLQEIAPDLKSVQLPKEFKTYHYDNTSDIQTLLWQIRKAEFYGMMQKTLRKVDLASMENSLEVRVPFLDKSMIQLALRIDPLLNYGANNQKQILKKVLHQRFTNIPKETQKKGFSIPLTSWLREDLKTLFYDTLLQDKMKDYGFDLRAIEKMISSHMNGERDYKWPIFTLYALTKWEK